MDNIEVVPEGIIVHYGGTPDFERCDMTGTLPNGKVVPSLCVLKKGHSCMCAMGMYQCEISPCKGCHMEVIEK